MKDRFFLLFFLVFVISCNAQLNYVVIDSISLEGNKKTKSSVVKRELGFVIGDTIPLAELTDRLDRSEQLLMNTLLFTTVEINYKNWEAENNHVHIHIDVKEAWYIYPVPSFSLADRNFNVWWVDHKASLRRTNIGLDFTHLNTTGRGDRLKFAFQIGYTQRYRLRYISRTLNKKQTLGLTANLAYLQNREVNYATQDNKQAFFDGEENISYFRFIADLAFAYRPKLNDTHEFQIGFRQNRVTNEVALDLNPDFFLNGRNFQRYFVLEYLYTYDTRDVRNYPMNGNFISASLQKDGIGIYGDRNGLTSILEYEIYRPILKKFNLGIATKAKYSLIRSQQPYNDNRAIGFNQSDLRGYEFYIVDGLDMLLLNSSIKFQLFKTVINFGNLVPIAAFRKVPIRMNLSLNNDFGFVNNPYENGANDFNNRLLWGRGLGLDTIVFFDFVFRIEYSFNHLGESGIFLHFNSSI